MRPRHFILATTLLLIACSPEVKSADRASSAVASRLWTDPQVARAINVRATHVADYKPGADILFSMLPTSLALATYGEFDSFMNVTFDNDLATHAQVLAGMQRYCAEMGRQLVSVGQGNMDVPPGQPQLKAWGYVSGLCR
jgi:hypothetical protein